LKTRFSYLVAAAALVMITFGSWTLEQARSGVEITSQNIGSVPCCSRRLTGQLSLGLARGAFPHLRHQTVYVPW